MSATAWLSLSALITRLSAAWWSRISRVVDLQGLGGTVTLKVASSVPIRSTLPLATHRSVLDSIRSLSVSISWNLMEELPQFKTRIFIAHPGIVQLSGKTCRGNSSMSPGRNGVLMITAHYNTLPHSEQISCQTIGRIVSFRFDPDCLGSRRPLSLACFMSNDNKGAAVQVE